MSIKKTYNKIKTHIYNNRGSYGILAGTLLATAASIVIDSRWENAQQDEWDYYDKKAVDTFGEDAFAVVDRNGDFGYVGTQTDLPAEED